MIKKFLGVICLLYSLIIIYVWSSGTLKNFLAPNMQIYIKFSLIPLLIMSLILLLNSKINYKFKVSDLILILPFFMLIFASDGRLSSSFASNRTTNFNKKTTIKNETTKEKENVITIYEIGEEVVEEDEIESYKVYDFSSPYFDIIDENYDELSGYISYHEKASKYIGKTIRVRGFIQKYASYIPDSYFTIGKYSISCCAADASFVGFFVKYDVDKIKNGNWYEIEGVLEQGIDNDGYNVMVINPVNIKEIKAKDEEEYVYACFVYGDGNCSELTKYNLEY